MSDTSQAESASNPSWQAESSHPDKIELLREKLREVYDPEIGLNVIELGLVRNVVIQDQQAEIEMILTTPFCPYAPMMLEMTRVKAEEALGMPTTIEMGMEAWEPSMMEDGIDAGWGLF